MSYGDCNFPSGRVDIARLILLLGTLIVCLVSVIWAAVSAAVNAVPAKEPAAQYAPRNIPDGNTHLQR